MIFPDLDPLKINTDIVKDYCTSSETFIQPYPKLEMSCGTVTATIL